MSYYLTTDFAKAIIQLLTQMDKPLELDEISFRTRLPQSMVVDTLSKLVQAHVVMKEGNFFKVNRNEPYKLSSLVA